MRSQYPPLEALLFFLVTSRTQSFTLAAEVLFVTRSAVSRRVKKLEGHLGVQLFHRYQTHLELTSAGLEYANELSTIFADLKVATEHLKGKNRNKLKITLKLSATFTTTWLSQRLQNLEEVHPELVVAFRTNSIDTGTECPDFESGNIDAAILLGTGLWNNCASEKLIDIFVQPICSPKVLKHMSDNNPGRLEKYNWLHYEHLPDLWPTWLEAAGLSGLITTKKNIVFDNVALATQAAMDGMGIIPMYRPFADPKMDDGKLVAAHDTLYQLPQSYYFICSTEYEQFEAIKIFRKWILEQARNFRETWII